MNKEEFNNLTIEEQVDYVNKNGGALAVQKKVGVAESTLRSRFKKANYFKNKETNLFEKMDVIQGNIDLIQEHKSNVIHDIKDVIQDNKRDVIQSNTQLIQEHKKDVIHDNTLKEDEVEKMQYLLNNFDILQKVIEDVREGKEVSKGMEINVPMGAEKRTTIWINESIYNQFQEFCNIYPQYNKKDIWGQALKEFMENHSKMDVVK